LFEEIFTRFHERNKSIKAVGVWGKDGLELEKRYFSNSSEITRSIDLEFSSAELADILTKLDRTKSASDRFFMKLNYRGLILMIYSLTRDYFLVILTGEDIIEGKLKFYLDLYKEQLIGLL
jgi:predicted regulator of Ras-like GTPase activity (Roadblock/LC7/MglB family)